jgi:hypothetical protein
MLIPERRSNYSARCTSDNVDESDRSVNTKRVYDSGTIVGTAGGVAEAIDQVGAPAATATRTRAGTSLTPVSTGHTFRRRSKALYAQRLMPIRQRDLCSWYSQRRTVEVFT